MTFSTRPDQDEQYRALRDALSDLYDPTSTIPPIVSEMLGYPAGISSPDDVRTDLIRAIRSMRPEPGVPADSRSWRLYRILSLRYVQNRTQAECAERLGLTTRHLAREQNEAIHLLGTLLKPTQRSGSKVAKTADEVPGSSAETLKQSASQLDAELESLAQHTPGSYTEIGGQVRLMLPLLRQIAETHGIELSCTVPETESLAAIHNSVFRQVVIGAFYHLAKQMTRGSVDVQTTTADAAGVRIILRAQPIHAIAPSPGWIPGILVLSHGGDWKWNRCGHSSGLSITFPSRTKHTVLVVDDNQDLQHYYRLCAEGSVFDLVSVASGGEVFDAIRAISPSAIMLDIMLPDIDGWELLRQLRVCDVSRDIPIIICSVIREEDLGRDLGAGMYLTKPILRETLLEALHACLGLT